MPPLMKVHPLLPPPPPALPVIATGDEPRTVKEVHETVPEHVALVVATVPSSLSDVQYARFPIVGAAEVATPPKVSVPVVVIVPPMTGHVVAIEDTVALLVLQLGQVTAF